MAKDIDILVVNCSLFNPTPSLSAMIVNHFKMRSDLISYNLAGMGCSAGVIAIGLAERILRSEPGKYALVVSTENITQARAPARCAVPGSGLFTHEVVVCLWWCPRKTSCRRAAPVRCDGPYLVLSSMRWLCFFACDACDKR